MRTGFVALMLAAACLEACQPYNRSGESMTSGSLRAGIDESFTLLMQSEVDVFHNDYPAAEVKALFMPEADVIDALMRDSIQAAVITRDLTEEERAAFRNRQKLPESARIATDGIALIVHRENPDSVLRLSQVDSLFRGSISGWDQVGGKHQGEPVRIVFDNNRSSNARYIRERFLSGEEFPANCFAVHSNSEVIDYVSNNKDAIGVISVAWIADREDSTSQDFLSRVSVVGIIDPSNLDKPSMPRKPYQAYIWDKSYPLRRDVYAIRTSARTSVGTGFVSFLRGERGQLIIHKMGLVAEQTPARIIRISE